MPAARTMDRSQTCAASVCRRGCHTIRYLNPFISAGGCTILTAGLWRSSSARRFGTVAMDSLAVSYAGELARSGIETSIIVPGAFTAGTNHFKNAGSPNDTARAAEYTTGAYLGFADEIQKGLAAAVPSDADAAAVAAIVKVVGMPFGTRPFRTHVDPAQDGCEVVNAVADRIRAEFLRRIGLGDLLTPRTPATQGGPPALPGRQ